MNDELITIEDLCQRWHKKSKSSVRKIVHRYTKIIKPMRIGRDLMFYPENIKRFEEQCIIIKEEDNG